MFVVNNPNRAVAPLQGSKIEAPAPQAAPASAPTATPSDTSRFEASQAAPVNLGGVPRGGYWPTNAELQRPTTATVLNITNGERQPLNPVQMSSEQGVAFVQQRLAALGFSGSLTASNSTSPTTGPFRIDYGTDDRRHWDIGGLNAGLVQNLYANNPPHVADAMLRADLQHARSGPASWEADGAPTIPPNLTLPPSTAQAASATQATFRILPGTSGAPKPTPPAAPPSGPWRPTLEELQRPTTAASLDIRTGERIGLNAEQLSSQQGVDFLKQRLQALGYSGPGVVSNRTAPTTGPFGIDYGTDPRRHWDLDGMNVGLTLGLYARNPPDVADRMLADLLRQQRGPAEE